jgi:hypothetical protein
MTTPDPCMTCETLRDRVRELELAFVEQTARCAELACELAETKARSAEWLRVEERYPETGDFVVVLFNDNTCGLVLCMCAADGEPYWEDAYEDERWSVNDVKAWAPLPHGPEGAKAPEASE